MMEDKNEIEQVLTKAQVGRVGTSMRDRPYVVPINFVYHEGKIYFHSAPEGQMFSYMKANSQVCFEVDESEIVPNVDPCKFTFRYRSVIAFGKVRFLEDEHEKHRILNVLLKKYDAGKVAAYQIPEDRVKDVAVGEITLETMTGKKNEPSKTQP
jgi:nitroimidazol reductase NimA-like FMN-containing flavoprotein (pyridoxamine 5'-phosphate oxidase superfamily)